MLSIFFYGSMCFFRVETNPQFFFINWFLWFCRWKSNFIYQCNSNTCLCLSKDGRYNNLSYNSVIAFLVFGNLSFLENYWPWLFFSTADTMTFFSSFFLLSNLTRMWLIVMFINWCRWHKNNGSRVTARRLPHGPLFGFLLQSPFCFLPAWYVLIL